MRGSFNLVDVVVTTCGTRGAVRRTVGSILDRACAGFRLLIIGSYSASEATRLIGDVTTGSDHIHLVSGMGGGNISCAHGRKLRRTGNS